MVLLSSLGKSSGNSFLIPTQGSPGFTQVPVYLPENQTTDFSTSGNVTLKPGVHYFRNFTINASHQVTITGPTYIYCSGTFTVAGNGITTTTGTLHTGTTAAPIINVGGWAYKSDTLTSSTGFAYGTGSPGTGGGVGVAGNNATGQGAGGGGGGAASTNSGTTGGSAPETGLSAAINNPASTGGGGGGGAFGTGGNASGNGASTAAGTSNLGLLFVCANMVSITSDITFTGGAGSDGPAVASNTGAPGGGGGGRGGQIYLFANSITHSAGTVDASGGAGGDGGAAPGSGGGGGGAGGGPSGFVYWQAAGITLSGGTRTAVGGAAGTGGTSVSGGAGGDGSAGGTPLNYASAFLTVTGNPF